MIGINTGVMYSNSKVAAIEDTYGSNWILKGGDWNDDGVWVDSEVWKD